MKPVSSLRRHVQRVAVAALVATSFAGVARADETCNSPYMSGLIKGQEDYVHVWTLGVAGMGDGFDKLVTIDANPSRRLTARSCTRYRSAAAAKRTTWDLPMIAVTCGPGA